MSIFTRREFLEKSTIATGGLILSQGTLDWGGAELRIEFVGLCAFVPFAGDIAVPPPSRDALRVALMNAEYFQYLDPPLGPHAPVLGVSEDILRTIEGGTTASDEEVQRWRQGLQGRFRKWDLTGRAVKFEVSRSAPLKGKCSKAARLGDALKSAPGVPPVSLKTDWWRTCDIAKSNVALLHGRIKEGDPRKANYNYDFYDADWTFQPHVHPRVEQKMKDAFVCKTKHVTAILIDGYDPIRLKPGAKGRVFIANLPNCPHETDTPQIVHHVRAYYALFNPFDTRTPRADLDRTPVPIAQRLDRLPRERLAQACLRNEGDIYCPGGRP